MAVEIDGNDDGNDDDADDCSAFTGKMEIFRLLRD